VGKTIWKNYGKLWRGNFFWDNGGKLMKMDCFLMFAAYSSSVKASSLSKMGIICWRVNHFLRPDFLFSIVLVTLR
jgi:hypothetical protein